MRDGSRTKQKIAEVALVLFVDKGVAETSIRDIARGAEIAEGALYRHYASKDDLAWRLFADSYVALARMLDDLQARQAGFRGKIEVLVRQFCQAFDDNPVLFSYLLLTQHDQIKKLSAEMPSPIRVVHRVIAEGLARQAGDKRNPDVVAAMVMGVVMQVAVELMYGRIAGRLTDQAELLIDACWRIIQA
ncbi:MAG: TetR/AcrR family transcriptional regulator [Dongiaceae bacterium]